MKKLLPLILWLVLLTGCTTNTDYQQKVSFDSISETKEEGIIKSNYINIKYRDDAVNIGDPRFEYLNTSKSSFVRGAWYDNKNKYMLIKLKSTYYHYCGLPENTWTSFKQADSFGTYYNKYIYHNYDCRYNYVPTY